MSPRSPRATVGAAARACSLGLVLLLWGWSLASPPGVAAVEVPASAFSQSLAAAPEFFDHPSLICVYPQRALGLSRRIMLFGTARGPEASAGVWSLGRTRAFLLSQRGSLASGIDAYRLSTISTLRGGLACPIGGWRVGLSVAGGLDKLSSVNETLRYENSTGRYSYEYRATEETIRTGDVLLGLGRGSGRASCDVTFETRWEKQDDGIIRATETNTSSDTIVVSFEGDERPRQAAYLRLQLPLSSELDGFLLADWTGYQVRRSGRFLGSLFDTPVDSSRVETAYSDKWRAAIGVSRPIQPLDFILLSASYRAMRTPQFIAESYGPTRYYTTRRWLELSTSAREELRRDLWVYVGFSRRYDLQKSSGEAIGYGGGSYSLAQSRSDSMSQQFDWGAAWKWRNLQLTGAMKSVLALDNLFSTIDLELTF